MNPYRRKVISIACEEFPFLHESVKNSRDSYHAIKELFDNEQISILEEMHAIYLDKSSKVVGHAVIGKGSEAGVVVSIKVILKHAIDCLASGIIIAHNHPSGSTEPSNADKELTVRLRKACETMDIVLMDHLIITPQTYFSFADEGFMY